MTATGRTLETARLLLHPWREQDQHELERLLADPVVRGGRNLPPERIAALSAASLSQWRVNGFGPWAAIDKSTGAWIGRIGLTYRGRRFWKSPDIAVVWYAIDRDMWNG